MGHNARASRMAERRDIGFAPGLLTPPWYRRSQVLFRRQSDTTSGTLWGKRKLSQADINLGVVVRLPPDLGEMQPAFPVRQRSWASESETV